jgi:SAM-dependent methyltransferase
MHWKTKAKIMRACAALPRGDRLYLWIQKNFGRLSGDPDPFSSLDRHLVLADWLRGLGFSIAGKSFLEVGTGHVSTAAISFFLMGAERVTTVDLNRRLDMPLLTGFLRWIADRRSELEARYAPFTERDVLAKRLDTVERYANDPVAFLRAANIVYMAPADAADTGLSSSSIDCHFSVNVLEHINRDTLQKIFDEARRTLRAGGVGLHMIDLSDHFQHQNKRISLINFLRYSDREWNSLAGNEFAYTNRLRARDYDQLFRKARFRVVRDERKVDDDAIAILADGFPLDEQYRTLTAEQVCTVSLLVAMVIPTSS